MCGFSACGLIRLVMRTRNQQGGMSAEQVREVKALSHASSTKSFSELELLEVPRSVEGALLTSRCQQGEQALADFAVKGTGDSANAVTGVVVSWVQPRRDLLDGRLQQEAVMLTVIAATLFAILIVVWVLTSRNRDTSQLIEPRNSSLEVSVQIVCGDCAGSNRHPRRTLLTCAGVCEQCGGMSYVLASEWAMMRLAAGRSAQIESRPRATARVLSFDRQTASRAVSRERVAI